MGTVRIPVTGLFIQNCIWVAFLIISFNMVNIDDSGSDFASALPVNANSKGLDENIFEMGIFKLLQGSQLGALVVYHAKRLIVLIFLVIVI